MTLPVAGALNVGPSRKPTSLVFTMALENLADVCRQIRDLEDLYDRRKAELLEERNTMIVDAAESRVAIRQLQIISGLSRSRIYELRASGGHD